LIGVCKSPAILGKAGRYMSIDKGPKAVKLTKVRIRIQSCKVSLLKLKTNRKIPDYK
jgi:hypothetical protein